MDFECFEPADAAALSGAWNHGCVYEESPLCRPTSRRRMWRILAVSVAACDTA